MQSIFSTLAAHVYIMHKCLDTCSQVSLIFHAVNDHMPRSRLVRGINPARSSTTVSSSQPHAHTPVCLRVPPSHTAGIAMSTCSQLALQVICTLHSPVPPNNCVYFLRNMQRRLGVLCPPKVASYTERSSGHNARRKHLHVPITAAASRQECISWLPRLRPARLL